MKKILANSLILAALAISPAMFSGCAEPTPEDHMEDARENLEDAAEDAGEAVEEAMEE